MKDPRYKIQKSLNYFVDDVLGIVQNFQSQYRVTSNKTSQTNI